MQLIDSSVWVALYLDFDTNHEKAIKLFSKITDKIFLPYCVINEVATVLTYKHSKKQANAFLKYVTENESIVIMENDTKNEIEFYQKINKKISFTDASLVYLAQKFDLLLITFDKQIIRLIKEKQ